MYTFISNGHRIDIKNTWTGKETILYDGKIVSEKRSMFGANHVFQVQEDDELVQYEIQFSVGSTSVKVVARRNGLIIFTNDDGFIPPPDPMLKTASSPTVKETIIKEIILVVCPHCSHRNESSKRRCEKCGSSI